VPYSGIVPGASIVFQSHGNFLNLNPHLHAIVADGGFFENNSFRIAPQFLGKNLEKAFRYEVLKMLKKEGKINDAIIGNLLSWRHAGFHVYLGPRIRPDDHDALERLARYIIRACFSSDRMDYIPAEKTPDGIAKVIYTSKDDKSSQTFDALDRPARLVTHVPGRYEHTVRYYGYYSNKSRGMRKKADADDYIATIAPNELSPKQFAQNRARLIQKIYEVDPLVCPKCQGNMRIIVFIEDTTLIQVILKHPGLWETKNHDPPPLDSFHTTNELTVYMDQVRRIADTIMEIENGMLIRRL
jgi:hypothetical protein